MVLKGGVLNLLGTTGVRLGGGCARSPAVPGCAGSPPAALPTPAGSRRPRRRWPWRRGSGGWRPAGKAAEEKKQRGWRPPGTGPGAAAVFRARPEPGEAGPAPGWGDPEGGCRHPASPEQPRSRFGVFGFATGVTGGAPPPLTMLGVRGGWGRAGRGGGEHPEPRGDKCLAWSAGRAQEGFCVGFLFCGVCGRSQSAAGQRGSTAGVVL